MEREERPGYEYRRRGEKRGTFMKREVRVIEESKFGSFSLLLLCSGCYRYCHGHTSLSLFYEEKNKADLLLV